jgi:hypothetical protein
MAGRVQQILASLAVGWALVASIGAVRGARAQPLDPMKRLEAEFRPLAKDLPPAGEVGFLDRYVDAGAEDAQRVHFAAQYALVPRVVLARVGLEFMIVAQGAAQPDYDPRLDGYYLVSTTPEDHRVYRRLVR